MTDSIKIKCGVLGVGFLGQHHARLYKELPDCTLVGIYDSNLERAQEIAKEYDCHVFESEEALGQACDAVSVVVPTDKHHKVSLPLLRAGCHLLIEKPICTTVKEAEEILAVAKEHNRIVQVGHVEHFNPVVDFLEKELTEPRFITIDRLAPYNPRGTEVGVVLDLMIHDIGVLLQLVKSPIESMDCVGVNVLSSKEDIANVRITFKNGCVANLNTSRVSLKKVREIRVFQPYTYLSLNFMEQKGHLLKKEGFGIKKIDIPIEKGEPLKLELAAFINCVHQVLQPKVCGQLGKSALEVALLITEQIKEKAEKYANFV